MKVEEFNSILQDAQTSMEKYLKKLIDKDYTLTVIETVKNYSLNVKNTITEQYNSLSDDLQNNVKNKFKDFFVNCDTMLQEVIEKAIQNNKKLLLSNDVFYFEDLYSFTNDES